MAFRFWKLDLWIWIGVAGVTRKVVFVMLDTEPWPWLGTPTRTLGQRHVLSPFLSFFLYIQLHAPSLR